MTFFGTPDMRYTLRQLEVFLAMPGTRDQGHGEGSTFLGSTVASGSGAWSLTLVSGQVARGQRVTATATTPVAFNVSAETSEFAANVSGQ